VGVSVLGLISVVFSWFLIDTAGRRSSLLVGTVFLTLLVLPIGILDVIPSPANN
jgi:branched-subunit amino acid permease